MPTKTITKTVTEDTPADVPHTLEEWLAGLPDGIKHVDVWRKAPGGIKLNWLPQARMYPPFTIDAVGFFTQWGDGEYRFLPIREAGGTHGSRMESVEGYGLGQAPKTAPGGNQAGHPVDFGQLTESIKSQLDYEMLMGRLDDLEARRTRREAQQAPMPEASERLSAEDREALHTESFSRQIELFSKLALLTRPDHSWLKDIMVPLAGLVGPLIQRLLAPSEPADKLLGMVEKFLDLRERMVTDGAANGGGDWKSALAAVLGPAVRDLLQQARTRGLVPTGAPEPEQPAIAAAPPIEPAAPAPNPPGVLREPEPAGSAARRAILSVWPVLKRAALSSSESFDLYAELIDEQLPGLLDMWTGLPPEDAVLWLAQFDPEASASEPIRLWLLRFHAEAKQQPKPEGDDDAH